ncbi:single-stranded DNA-binding protein [Corynebacterium falsenii]|uniref:Single-stranded DNA-binding protein n=1 Tax=Corynebacterium falsenii TaxID=108486 RepID=A0A418Q6R4_9CORY|nr:single-stranded DNA-binding protein [Corynebacterium falsenii]RIX34609.1 single-stranded DNA-binding protein [Corynebacterium falsenii]
MSSNLASVHLVGNAVKDPETIFHADDQGRGLVSVRMAVNSRYLANDGKWTDGDTTYVEVQCWNKLGVNVDFSVKKGMPIIVIGRLVQSTWESTNDDGSTQRRSVLRVKASHVGPDLNNRMARTFKPFTDEDAEQTGASEGQQSGQQSGQQGQQGQQERPGQSGQPGEPDYPAADASMPAAEPEGSLVAAGADVKPPF